MKIFISVLIVLLSAVSCSSTICSSTNSSCTFGALQNSSNLLSVSNNDKSVKKRNYDAAIISDLSPDPILIEKIDAEIIKREANRPLSLPTSLLQFSPSSYRRQAFHICVRRD